MTIRLTHATLLVDDYDDAIKWWTEIFGLELRMDNEFGEGRFVTVGAKGQDVQIVLHMPQDGSGAGRHANDVHGLVFAPDDCRRQCETLKERGVSIVQGPEDVPWGVQPVIEDLYGNTHVLVEQRPFSGQD